MYHQHPLAYVIGLEGIALLRSFCGDFDRAFVEERLAEIRRLLDDEKLMDAGVDVEQISTVEGYRLWAPSYDGPNSAFDAEQSVVREILDELPAGVALDAACGTGRYAVYLSEHGHQVLGVDTSPDMLELARKRVPAGDFRIGALTRLPVGDDEVDTVVCALALSHVPDLVPVFAEFARVLRPGGHLVISDIHPEGVARGVIPATIREGLPPARIESYTRITGDYLRAALRVGFQVLRCDEPMPPEGEIPAPADGDVALEPWYTWPWSLVDLAPVAAWAAGNRRPLTLIWHFRLA